MSIHRVSCVLVVSCLVAILLLIPVLAVADSTLDRRIELARKIHDLQPVKAQVDSAIRAYVAVFPPSQHEKIEASLSSILNHEAIETVSLDAYVDTFTVEELEVMYNYYALPQYESISEKSEAYNSVVYSEIVRLLDRAMMRVRTGG